MCLTDERARQWLSEGIQQGKKSFMVVELQTAEDAVIAQRKREGDSFGIDGTVPVATIATYGADLVLPDVAATLDPGLGGGTANSRELKKAFSLARESIFAIGYKKMVWKSWGLKKREVEKAALDADITWSILGQKRTQKEEEEKISVDLADDLRARDAPTGQASDGGDEEEDEAGGEELDELAKEEIEFEDMTYLVT
jgi:hypothetical protein